jgi:hypothetical protein
MKNLITGMLIGMILGGGIAWAAQGLVLQSGNGRELGTTANPMYIQAI